MSAVDEQAQAQPPTEPVQASEIDPAPPAGDRLHMPDSSILPVINAAGLSIAIVGIPISRLMIIAGLLVFVITAALWIRDARREFDELPLEEHH